MVGQLTWETQAPATCIFLDKSKNKQAWKVGAPYSLGRPLGTHGLTGELDTMELASNLYQFPLGSDQLVLSY